MTTDELRLLDLQLHAWVGEDELGSGEIGLKQALVPAGMIPLVAIRCEKVATPLIELQLALQSQHHGKHIFLVRFQAVEIVKAIGQSKEAE